MKTFLISIMVLLGTVACTHHDSSSNSNAASLSFSTIQTAVIAPKCLSCHSGKNISGGIDLSDYDKMIKSGVIVRGAPYESPFYTSIANGSMPPGAALSRDLVRIIQDWIQKGAKLNSGVVVSLLSPPSTLEGVPTPLSIKGEGFQPGARILFNQLSGLSPSFVSASNLSVVSPALSAGVYDITVTNPDSSYFILKSGFTVAAEGNGASPAISKIFPSRGATNTAIEITGINFVSKTRVRIGDQDCLETKVNSPNSITCSTPRRDTSGPSSVSVSNPDGANFEFSSGYTYTISASFTSILNNILIPKCVSCHGATGQIAAGASFINYDKFITSGTVMPGDPDNSTFYTYPASDREPRAPTSGIAPPRLTAEEKLMIKNFILNYAPNDTPAKVTSITPNIGSINGGTVVTIAGTGFLPEATVNIGGSPCTPVTVNSAGKQATCSTSPHSVGATEVVIINPANGGNPPIASTGGEGLYNYLEGPNITLISPNTAKSSNQSPVTITGKNFKSTSIYKFGNKNCTNVGNLACTGTECTVTCIPPPQAAAEVSVKVTNPDGQFFDLPSGFAYTAGNPPVLSSVSPRFVYMGQTTLLTLTGSGFLAGAVPRISNQNNSCTNINLTSPTTITCNINTGNLNAGVQSVVVTNPDGLASGSASLDLRESIQFTNVSPPSGSVQGGNFLTVVGKGFVNGIKMTIGGVFCTSLQLNSSSNLICVAPPATGLSPGPKDIVLTNPADEAGSVFSATAVKAYLYE